MKLKVGDQCYMPQWNCDVTIVEGERERLVEFQRSKKQDRSLSFLVARHDDIDPPAGSAGWAASSNQLHKLQSGTPRSTSNWTRCPWKPKGVRL